MSSFLGSLLVDGWHADVPAANLNPIPNTNGPQVRTWCGYLLPELRIMTRSGSGVTQQYVSTNASLPDFGSDDCVAQYTAMLAGQAYPGFVAPGPTDAVAIVMGESRHAPPSEWAQATIEGHYDAGLRFLMVGYDVSDVAYNPEPDRFVFYSVPAEHRIAR